MEQAKQHLSRDDLTEEAVSWFLRIRHGLSQAEFREWRRWLAADDAHAAAFDGVREFWQVADHVADLPWPVDEELEADTYDGNAALPVPAKPVRKTRRLPGGGRFWLGAAASVVAACLIGIGLLRESGKVFSTHQTTTAEHRSIPLRDGSSVLLGAESELVVAYDRRARNIELRSGEAYFKVAKDGSRPFVVSAGSRKVRALGTEFGVNIGVRDIKVSVVEGKVSVESPPRNTDGASGGNGSATVLNLGRGDVLDFNAAGRVGIVSEVDPMLSTSWLTRRLAYDGASLESVIADLNRYSQTELIIGDDLTKQLTFTGTIFSDDIDNWLAGLEQVFPLRLVEVDGHGILLLHTER